jgi:hypothetical protein
MADTFKLTTVTASIAAQSITVVRADGVSVPLKIYDVSAFPDEVRQEDCPVLRPRPRDFISNFQFSPASLGGDAGYKNINYTLTYQLLYAPIGQSNTLFEHYGDMLNALAAVVLYFADNSQLVAGATELLPGPVPIVGGLLGSTDNGFHGAEIQFNVLQYLET